MKIETCMNINTIMLARLIDAASRLKISKSRLVANIFLRTMTDTLLIPKMFSRIEYQKRDPETDWHKLHVGLKVDEYEKCLDLRKVMKMSVSLILVLGIEKYLPGMLNGSENPVVIENADNSCSFYVFLANFDVHEKMFSMYWTPNERYYPLQQ